MQLEPVLAALRTTVADQLRLAAHDPHVEAAGEQLVDALAPALRSALIDLVQQAATEVDAQLSDHTVSVVLAAGDVELRVDDAPVRPAAAQEDLDARITLRLPPTLKQTIERFASVDGESVNSWVVEALAKRANRSNPAARSVTEEFDL